MPSRLLPLILLAFGTALLGQYSPGVNQPLPLARKNAVQSGPSQTDPAAQGRIVKSYGNLPLSFEANQGQSDARVKFLSRGNGYNLFLTADEAVFSLRGSEPSQAALPGTRESLSAKAPVQAFTSTPATNSVLRIKLRNADPAANVTGADELPGKSNYFIGNVPKMWHSNVRNYALAPKSKLHIRGLLSVLWDYAMWRGDVPTARNPMQLVNIKGASQRVHKPRNLTVEEFQSLLAVLDDDACWRTMLLLAISFGLRISEMLGLKWKDVDWLGKTIRIERGVVKQIVDDVKSSCSARTMVCADELLEVLKQWKQTTQFSTPEDWLFASPVKLGRQPLSYTFVWETLTNASTKAGIGHVSSHTFRHTHRSWPDSVGTPVGVQQKLMRHADIRTTMNLYGDAATADMRAAHEKIVRLALPQA